MLFRSLLMSRFGLNHSKGAGSLVGRALTQEAKGPGFKSRSGCTFFSPCAIKKYKINVISSRSNARIMTLKSDMIYKKRWKDDVFSNSLNIVPNLYYWLWLRKWNKTMWCTCTYGWISLLVPVLETLIDFHGCNFPQPIKRYSSMSAYEFYRTDCNLKFSGELLSLSDIAFWPHIMTLKSKVNSLFSRVFLQKLCYVQL